MTSNFRNDVWIYCDSRNQRLLGHSANMLSAARNVAEQIPGKCVAVLFGNPEQRKKHKQATFSSCIPSGQAVEDLITKGADYVYLIESFDQDFPRADIHSRMMTVLIKERLPKLVLFPLTDFGREVAARCASMCEAGLIADCVELKFDSGRVIAGCPSWGGEIMAELTYSDPSSTGFATVQPHAFQKCTTKGSPGSLERIRIDKPEITDRIRQLPYTAESAERKRLEDAKIVVAGGAGMSNSEGFGLVRKLSASLGGEVGATRPPVLSHWADEECLIGQTGKTVRPELLITIGTSGAVQYTAGITESKNIIAINRDPDSPIFNVADVGVVADARTLLPLLIEKIKKEVMRDLADFLTEEKKEEGQGEFGKKIHRLRESHGWSIEDLAQKTGQSPEHVQQVENDEIVPSVSFLLSVSRALGVDPGSFLRDDEKAAMREQRAQAFIKRTKNYYYQTLTPGAENEHLRGFMITIEPNQTHKPVAYKHEGEEFIYVMEGSLELTLENKKNHLKPGESIHFNSERPHKLKSLSKENTRCLVVLYTP
ncbi:MAG: FAD-binding protein [Deltaproteobacteria bacterium]|nr:FAD-binding protein [Deltaproteobacteria bacterium]